MQEKEMAEDEMVEWHNRLDGHEFEQAPGDGDKQRSLVCCSPWGHKESDMTEQLNNKRMHQKTQCTHLFLFQDKLSEAGCPELEGPLSHATEVPGVLFLPSTADRILAVPGASRLLPWLQVLIRGGGT